MLYEKKNYENYLRIIVFIYSRFASFVEGNSHLSDDEIVDYESYAFSLERSRKSNMLSSTSNHLEISDDDSSESDDDEEL